MDDDEVDDMASGGGCDIQGREGNVGATKQFKRIPVTKSVPRWTVIGSQIQYVGARGACEVLTYCPGQ